MVPPVSDVARRVPTARTGALAGARIVAVHPYPDLYGSDLMVVRSLLAMRRAGASVVLLVPEEGPLLQRLEDEDVAYRVVQSTVLRKSLLRPGPLLRTGARSTAEVARLRRLLHASRPDLVYVNTLTLPTWLLAARAAGISAVCHVRELEEGLPGSVARALTLPLLSATHLFVNSQATGRFLAGRWPALANRTSVVYNGLDFPPPEVDLTAEELRGGSARVVVVGRLSPRKGQDVAVRALAELVDRGVDVELDLVGDTFRGYEWFKRDLERIAHEHGIGDRVHLHGYQAPVWDWYRRADVVAVPSRLEPFGNVAAEALAQGSPVVVSGVGGLPEIVRDGESGLVVGSDDPVALADALGALLRRPDRAQQLALVGQREVRERFSADGYERRLLHALTAVLRPQRRASGPAASQRDVDFTRETAVAPTRVQ